MKVYAIQTLIKPQPVQILCCLILAAFSVNCLGITSQENFSKTSTILPSPSKPVTVESTREHPAPSEENAGVTEEASSKKNWGNDGQYAIGRKVELMFTGPMSKSLDSTRNPFALKVDVDFKSPDGESFLVPGFFDGDGDGGLDGNVWKVRFTPYLAGIWSFQVQSSNPILDGREGIFEVVDNLECLADQEYDKNLFCKGFLEAVGEHYFQFQDGDYWLKTGLDDPENFLGNAFGDWEAKKSHVDILYQMGVNSVYAIANNINGDRRDTWPWLGDNEAEAKSNSDRFDVAELQQWEDFFSYIQQKGIVLHFVFNDDSAWRGYDQELYIREMIARFGHNPGIIWNVGEEANEILSDRDQIEFADQIKEMDPYHHPVTVHRKSPWPFLGELSFDAASIQIGDGGADFSATRMVNINTIVIEHRERSTQRGHPVPIMVDETPRITEVNPEIREKFRKQVLYPVILGGGNFELHYWDAYGQNGTVSIPDLEILISDMVTLRHLLESFAFPVMQPCNQELSNPNNICFGESGNIYIIYFPEGGSESLDLSRTAGNFAYSWLDPRTGGVINTGIVQGSQETTINAPDEMDWVLLLEAE